ncbi:hypothetical protein PG999_011797 [Apiospora kogelbergensis]|uniref:Cytochrome P450 n=1 Tax=Apiospora kogelbergensis TaxID=1337665 RepID=A0AAW0QJL1_9PEZI
MTSTLALAAFVVAAVYALLHILLDWTQDSREPRAVERSIPFICPIFGMFRHKTLYYNQLRKQGNRLPIYTLRLPNVRAYIINDAELIPPMQRQWRTISFTPVMAGAGQATLGMSQAAADLLRKDITSDHNVVVGMIPLVARALAPGPKLDAMTRQAAEAMSKGMDQLEPRDGVPATVRLFEWTWHQLLMGTTEAVYGPKNPYRDPAVEHAWRTFEPRYLTLALSPLKTLTASKALQSRELLVLAFKAYLEGGGLETASEWIRASHAHYASHGFVADDLARFEVGHTHAISNTTAPTSWWLLWHLYSDPAVLREVRAELEALATTVEEQDGTLTKTVDLALVTAVSRAPQCLRLHTIATGVRLCLEDHMLQDRYLLKKGSVVIVPQPLHHLSTASWGEDAEQFNHRRFVATPRTTEKEKEAMGSDDKTNVNKRWRNGYDPAAFRAFGGGHTLCPGRHLSNSEILVFAAMMVLRFDLAPKHGAGKWEKPTWSQTHMVASLQIPDEDPEIEVRPRDSRIRWRFPGPN